MPKISNRGEIMPASPIRKLVPLANKAKQKGIKVYHLNIGQPDLPTPEIGLDAARYLDRKILEYSPSEGILSFREKLVEYYAKFNIQVNADDIIISFVENGKIYTNYSTEEGNLAKLVGMLEISKTMILED